MVFEKSFPREFLGPILFHESKRVFNRQKPSLHGLPDVPDVFSPFHWRCCAYLGNPIRKSPRKPIRRNLLKYVVVKVCIPKHLHIHTHTYIYIHTYIDQRWCSFPMSGIASAHETIHRYNQGCMGSICAPSAHIIPYHSVFRGCVLVGFSSCIQLDFGFCILDG